MKHFKTIISILLAFAFVFSACLFTSCQSLTGVGENEEVQEDETGKASDPSKETPYGKEPGLYNSNTGELKYAWEELETRGLVTVDENFITKSVSYLRGDLYVPNSISGIGKKAFYSCSGLIGIYMGNGVTTVNDNAFYGCTGLNVVKFGTGITNIANNAFAYCTKLPEIIIPDTVTNIGKNAFQGCTGLIKVHIGDGITNVSAQAFSGCTGLNYIRFGNKLTNIGNKAFYNCEVIVVVDFNGTKNEWSAVYIDKGNEYLENTTIKTTEPLVAIPNDATNRSRALLLLESLGYIKLNGSLTPTTASITSNPYGIVFMEVKASELPTYRSYVDYVIMNRPDGSNPSIDSLALENSTSPYCNVLAIKSGNENSDKIKALSAALSSKNVADYIFETHKGSIVPVTEALNDEFSNDVNYKNLKGSTISVAVSSSLHAEILNVAKEILSKKDITLEIKEYPSNTDLNYLVESGAVDANYCQNVNVINKYNTENSASIVPVLAVHIEPMAIYSGLQSSLDYIKNGNK